MGRGASPHCRGVIQVWRGFLTVLALGCVVGRHVAAAQGDHHACHGVSELLASVSERRAAAGARDQPACARDHKTVRGAKEWGRGAHKYLMNENSRMPPPQAHTDTPTPSYHGTREQAAERMRKKRGDAETTKLLATAGGLRAQQQEEEEAARIKKAGALVNAIMRSGASTALGLDRAPDRTEACTRLRAFFEEQMAAGVVLKDPGELEAICWTDEQMWRAEFVFGGPHATMLEPSEIITGTKAAKDVGDLELSSHPAPVGMPVKKDRTKGGIVELTVVEGPLGLGVKAHAGSIVVGSIVDGGVTAESNGSVVKGMQLLAVNGTNVKHMSVSELGRVLEPRPLSLRFGPKPSHRRRLHTMFGGGGLVRSNHRKKRKARRTMLLGSERRIKLQKSRRHSARAMLGQYAQLHRMSLHHRAADINTFEAGLLTVCTVFLTCGVAAYPSGGAGLGGNKGRIVSYMLVACFAVALLYIVYMVYDQIRFAFQQDRDRRDHAAATLQRFMRHHQHRKHEHATHAGSAHVAGKIHGKGKSGGHHGRSRHMRGAGKDDKRDGNALRVQHVPSELADRIQQGATQPVEPPPITDRLETMVSNLADQGQSVDERGRSPREDM